MPPGTRELTGQMLPSQPGAERPLRHQDNAGSFMP